MISMCMCWNRELGIAKSPRGVVVCLGTFDRWQDWHARVQLRQSFYTPGQANRSEMSLAVTLVPRWLRTWRESNILHRSFAGTYGRGLVVDMLQCIATSVPETWISSNRRAVVPCKRLMSSKSVACASAKASGQTVVQTAYTQDRVSATTLSCPDMWRMSVVNCGMKSRWLNCRGLHLSRFRLKA